MNLIGFSRLLHNIFFARKPDLDTIRGLGLLAVKIGQVYALRSDFLGVEKTMELMKLYEKNYDKQGSTDDPNALLQETLTDDKYRDFDLVNARLLAEASIGRVWLVGRDDDQVVVKIVKQDFRESFEKDVRRVMGYFRLLVFFYPKLKRVADPIGTLEDIRRMTLSELDMFNEIHGQKQLRDIFSPHEEFLRGNTTHYWKWHQLYEELSNQKVLVSEPIDGQSFNDLLHEGTLPYQALIDFFFLHVFGMLASGVFHEDIHPGNVFLTKAGEIVVLDTGSIGSASERIRENLYLMFASLVRGDYGQAAKNLSDMSLNGDAIAPNKRAQFEQKFLDLYENFANKTLSELSLTGQMMKSIKLAVHHGYEFERGMYPIIKAFMYLDGMALRCRPDTNLMKDIEPLIDVFEKYRAEG